MASGIIFKISGTEEDVVDALNEVLHAAYNLREATKKHDAELSESSLRGKVVCEQKMDQVIAKYVKQ